MSPFLWILLSGLVMSAIALVGSVTLLLDEAKLERILLPLVAFAAGTLLGDAFFHLLPTAVAAAGPHRRRAPQPARGPGRRRRVPRGHPHRHPGLARHLAFAFGIALLCLLAVLLG